VHLKDSEPLLSIFLWFCRLILAQFRRTRLQRGKVGSSVAVACSMLWGRPGLRPPGLMSICFTGHLSPGPWRSDLMIHWALGPFVRSFTLPVDPGYIRPPHHLKVFSLQFNLYWKMALTKKLLLSLFCLWIYPWFWIILFLHYLYHLLFSYIKSVYKVWY
jgi:hypothetical protein